MSVLPLAANDSPLAQLIDRLSQLPTYTIGRTPANAIVIPDAKVSGSHARLIRCTTNSYVLEDLDSKNGTFVNGARVTRKVVDHQDQIRLADTTTYTVDQLLNTLQSAPAGPASAGPPTPKPLAKADNAALDFTHAFAELQAVYEQYPQLRRDCRHREKMIRTGSVLLSSIVGISATVATGGAALPLLHIMSGAGLSILVPTLCSTLLSTDEKLELIDKEYRERYRCPNSNCRDPFGLRDWPALAQQKTCRRCGAVWVH